jgi:pimeloyl-ACP methyl ester carboxylesterase
MTQNLPAANLKRPPGALASLQRRILFGLWLIAAAWFWFFWPRSPMVAWVGTMFWLFGYTLMLATELLVMQWINRLDPVPRATLTELLMAWLSECWIATVVFGWRQPFRPNAAPDSLVGARLKGQRGVVFIHGLVCNRGFWTPWLERLQGSGHAYVAVNLEPVFGSIATYVQTIDAAVKAMTQASGMPPVLVCHSMGGLAARAWLARQAGTGHDAPVHRIVTIGSPHRGTWLARFGQSVNAAQMRVGSPWLAELDDAFDSKPKSATGEAGPLWLCWYSNCDHIVFPASSATLPDADNRLVRGAAHVQLAFVREVMDETLALLQLGSASNATSDESAPMR